MLIVDPRRRAFLTSRAGLTADGPLHHERGTGKVGA